MASSPFRPFWVIQYREARGHAIIFAGVLWIAAAVLIVTGSGYRDLFGNLKGADFVHFHALGHIALSGNVNALYDTRTLHAVQVSLVPESSPEWYLPINTPVLALIFAPFARFSYPAAAVLWALTNVAVYAFCVRAAWQPNRAVLSDRAFLVAAAAAFPPFWSLVLHGQTTAMPLIGFCLGWMALERGRPFVAGVALGLVLLKPPLAVAFVFVFLAAGEWLILSGLALSLGLQAGAVALSLGAQPIADYIQALLGGPRIASMLEPRPYQLHSIRAITNLMPAPWLGWIIWALLSAIVVGRTVRVWRCGAPTTARTAVLVLATVLVSPHLTIYDATLLALPFLWLGGWIESAGLRDVSRTFWSILYVLFLALLFPTALLIRVQISVLLLAWLFLIVTRAILSAAAAPSAAPVGSAS
jgi:hypothetical protein